MFLGVATAARAVTIDFESTPFGTVFGGQAGDIPGDIVLVEDGVNMSVQQFFFGNYVGFVKAEVGGKYAPFFPSTPLGLENIGVLFDFTTLPFDANTVTLDYQQFGGGNNLAVNGQTIYQVNNFAELPISVAPGVSAFVTNSQIILVGDINTLRIGGQEIGIDNISIIPEPATLVMLGLAAGVMVVSKRRARSNRS